MIAAAPRKKVNGLASIRPYRIGTSSGTRLAAWASNREIGSGLVPLVVSAWSASGIDRRAALPAAARCERVTRPARARWAKAAPDGAPGAINGPDPAIGRPSQPTRRGPGGFARPT